MKKHLLINLALAAALVLLVAFAWQWHRSTTVLAQSEHLNDGTFRTGIIEACLSGVFLLTALLLIKREHAALSTSEQRYRTLCEANVREITDRKRAAEALNRQNQRLQILQQAAADLLSGREPEAILTGLHEHIARNFGADVFTLYVAGSNGEGLGLRACGGVSQQIEQRLRGLRFGRALCVRKKEALEPIAATQLQTVEVPGRRFVRKLGFHSYLYYPLIVGERLLGTLAFASREREVFDPADQEFFQSIPRMLAEALERRRLESELQRYATRLEAMVQERTTKLRDTLVELDHVSYSMVHDMRAPLRAIRSFAIMLEEECAGCLRETKTFEYFRRIKSSSGRLDRLITDALNYSRVLREDLAVIPVELGGLLRSMLGTYPNLQPSAADISLEFNELVVLGNESLLTQCFAHLLGNAAKFVAPGVKPQIRVWAELGDLERGDVAAPERKPPQPKHASGSTLEASTVRIWVEDNGIGIPQGAHEKIFRMFYRMHREDEYPGTGIGLAIVRKAVDRMGGRVGLESEPGKGSRFWIELPLARQAPSEARK